MRALVRVLVRRVTAQIAEPGATERLHDDGRGITGAKGAAMSDEQATETTQDGTLARTADAVGSTLGSAALVVTEGAQKAATTVAKSAAETATITARRVM